MGSWGYNPTYRGYNPRYFFGRGRSCDILMATSYKQLRIASRLHHMGGSLGVDNFCIFHRALPEKKNTNMVPLTMEAGGWKMFGFFCSFSKG